MVGAVEELIVIASVEALRAALVPVGGVLSAAFSVIGRLASGVDALGAGVLMATLSIVR